MIRSFFTILSLYFYCSSLIGQVIDKPKDRYIIWSDSISIEVKDFKSRTKYHNSQKSTYLFDEENAITECGIQGSIDQSNNEFSILVIPYFDRNKSWIDTVGFGIYEIKQLIIHEMGHFNITEYIARLIRQSADSLSVNKCSDINMYRKLFKESYQTLEELHNIYDKETGHGLVLRKQDEWNIKMEDLLENLKEYSTDQYPVNNNILVGIIQGQD